MAYNKDNLTLQTTVPFNGRRRDWKYVSTDAIATVRAAGYISNATAMGMNVGDMVSIHDTTNNLQYISYVAAITAGAADLVDGQAIPTTNT
jgi:hypothetical protein